MSWLDWMWDDYANPDNCGYITFEEIKALLKLKWNLDNVQITNNDYYLTNLSSWKKVLFFNNFKWIRYKLDHFDCDSYSLCWMGKVRYIMPGYLIGLVFVDRGYDKHALNWIITPDFDLLLLEPQTNEIFDLPKKWKPYFALV